MKYFLYFFFAGFVFFYACSKDSGGPKTISPSNAILLSNSISLYHFAEATNGRLPERKGKKLVLDESYYNHAVKGISGRYVVVKPRVSEGIVAGYYVNIPGSNKTFTIHYKKPVLRGGAPCNPITTNDSLIIIKLPDNVLNGYFNVEYAAYDDEGNISSPIRAQVEVLLPAKESQKKDFSGSWKIENQKQRDGGWGSNEIVLHSEYKLYYCNNAILTEVEPGKTYDNMSHIPVYASYFKNGSFLFQAVNDRFTSEMMTKKLDKAFSSCSNVLYQSRTSKEECHIGWSYDELNHQLVLVYDNNGFPCLQPNFHVFDVMEKTANKMVLYEAQSKIGFQCAKQ